METIQGYKIGDCVKLMKELPGNSVDLCVTSPPYDNLRDYGRYVFDFESTAKELYRIIKKGGVAVWVVGDQTKNGSESGTSFKQALYFKEIGFNLHDTMIYQKINYVPLTHRRYEQTFEYIFILSKGKPKTFNPIMIPCKNAGKVEKYGLDRRQNHGKNHSMRLYNTTTYIKTKDMKIAPNIFAYTVGRDRTGHPAPFPEKLVCDQIISWSNPNDFVLDPLCGSGTTLKACRKLGRNGIGFESNPKYEEIIKGKIGKENV